MMSDDMELVREYASRGSENAFATLVSRHTNLVFSAASRQARDPQLAEEVTQVVFILVARKARSLGRKTILPSWLYRAACYVSRSALKGERRRQRREQEAYMQSHLHESQGDSSWQHLSPLLDDAMLRLGQADRDALVLRFFEGRSLNEVGAALGTSEEAAKKRVHRAVEKLRSLFAQRGIIVPAAALTAAISAHSVQAAPPVLAKSVTAVALTPAASLSTSALTLTKGALKLMAWTKAKTVAAVAVAAVILAAGTTAVVVATGVLSAPVGLLLPFRSHKIFTDGLNKAASLPDLLFTFPDGDETTRRYIEGIVRRFWKNLDPAKVIKSDLDLSAEEIQTRTIYIYGSPENHSLLRRLREQLPIVFEDDGVLVGKRKCLGRDVGAIFTCPNPLSPRRQIVVYGTVSPEALKDMNDVYHGPTDYIVFNDATRRFTRAKVSDRFLLLGSFDKSDPARWRVDDQLQIFPPKDLQHATASEIETSRGAP